MTGDPRFAGRDEDGSTTGHLTVDERRGARSAMLSFVLPGLGQIVSGRFRSGAVFAAPVVGLALAVGVLLVVGGPGLALLLDPAVLATLLVLNAFLFLWRAGAVLHGYSLHAATSSKRAAVAIPWALVVLVGVTQAIPSVYVARVAGTLERLSDQEGSQDDRLLGPAPTSQPPADGEGAVATDAATTTPTIVPPAPSSGLPSASSTSEPTPTSTVTPPAQSGEPARLEERVTVLLIGTDHLASREHRLTDTMLVASLGAEHRRPMMISVPRDIYGAPLPDGRVYNARLNSLAGYARARPDEFPLGGVGTLRATVEALLGMEIDYVASVDMLGLIEIVDALGGVEVTVREEVDDPSYRPAAGGPAGLHLEAGDHHMDGPTALAYARSRLGPGGSDFVRADRQQRLLAAIRDRIRELGLVSTLPTLLEVTDENVRTDIPRDRLGPFAEAVVDARWEAIERLVLTPPRFVTPAFTDGGAYVLRPDIIEIRRAVTAMRDG